MHDHDRASIQLSNLIARYAELIDAGDLDGVGDLFGRAAVGVGENLLCGREAILALYTATTRRHPDGTPGTKHVTHQSHLDIDEEPAPPRPARTGRCSRPCPASPSSPSWPAATTTGSPADDEGWHFVERQYLVDLVGDVSHHMIGT